MSNTDPDMSGMPRIARGSEKAVAAAAAQDALARALADAGDAPPCRARPDLWTAEDERTLAIAAAACAPCPALAACRRYAVTVREPAGAWGGTTPRQRDEPRLARQREAARRAKAKRRRAEAAVEHHQKENTMNDHSNIDPTTPETSGENIVEVAPAPLTRAEHIGLARDMVAFIEAVLSGDADRGNSILAVLDERERWQAFGILASFVSTALETDKGVRLEVFIASLHHLLEKAADEEAAS